MLSLDFVIVILLLFFPRLFFDLDSYHSQFCFDISRSYLLPLLEYYVLPNPNPFSELYSPLGLHSETLCPDLDYQRSRSLRIRRVSWMSLGMMVTLLAWMAHKFVSSKSPTRYASEASCDAPNAED